MTQDQEKPSRYELKKYQAGYGLLIIAAFVAAFGFVFNLWPAYLIVAFLAGAGIAFQFDKERGKKGPPADRRED